MFQMQQKLIALSVVLALSACGGGSSSSTPPPAAKATVATSLSAATVTSPSGTVNLTFTVTNTGTTAVNDGAFTLPLPAGLKNMSVVGLGAPCDAFSIGLGGSGFVVSGMIVPAGATCTNVITLTPSTPGTFVFTPTGLTSVTAGATATLTIN